MRKIGVILFGAFLLFAGISHFLNPDFFLILMPESWPAREWLNWISGAAEIVLALLWFFPSTRKQAGLVIVLMLIAFWVLHGIHLFYPPKPEWPLWAYIIRFVLQAPMIWMVLTLRKPAQK